MPLIKNNTGRKAHHKNGIIGLFYEWIWTILYDAVCLVGIKCIDVISTKFITVKYNCTPSPCTQQLLPITCIARGQKSECIHCKCHSHWQLYFNTALGHTNSANCITLPQQSLHILYFKKVQYFALIFFYHKGHQSCSIADYFRKRPGFFVAICYIVSTSCTSTPLKLKEQHYFSHFCLSVWSIKIYLRFATQTWR